MRRAPGSERQEANERGRSPIASVGEASIRAVIEPQETPYLFFVAKGDGTHHFSTNYQEHDRAVWRYQKRRRRPQR